MKLIRFLKGELAAEARDWVGEGLLHEEQARAILARYGASYDDTRRLRGYMVLLSLAAVMAGIGLILLLSHNWEQIPAAVKLGGILLLLALINLQGLRSWKQGNEAAARVWLLLGAIWYGAAIFLVAQIYHLGEHYPEGLALWAIGVTPLVLLTRSRALAWLALVVSSAGMAVETSQGGYPWLYPFALGALAYFVLYQRRNVLLFLALCIAFGAFLEVSLVHWVERAGLELELAPLFLASALFVCYQHLARWLARQTRSELWRDYGAALAMWALRYFLLALLLLGFPRAWEVLLLDATPLVPVDLFTAVGAIGISSLLVFLSLTRWYAGGDARQRADTDLLNRGLAVARVVGPALMLIMGCIALIALGDPGFSPEELVALHQHGGRGHGAHGWLTFNAPALLAVLTNIFLLVAGIWLIRRGVAERAMVPYYTGIVLLLLTGACRYVDLIGDYIGGALLFFAAAAVLVGAAKLWQRSLQVVDATLTREEVHHAS